MDGLYISRRVSASQGGQSLIEILLAIGIGTLLVGGAAAIIALSLRVDTANKPVQGALFAVQDLLDKVATLAEANWRANIGALSPSPVAYAVAVSGSAFTISEGSENVTIDGVPFTRFFTAEDVYRDSSGAIQSSGAVDPSTKKITATVRWAEGAGTTEFSLVKFVTRARNASTGQTDWSGGAGQTGAFVAPDKYDSADAGIDASVGGVIKVSL
ncbi:MAG: hypothetical protein HYT82_00195 [Candidatus Harrisonbacteria bacterium]|nr:hypothetical protein [Candidatus Harrisonbacteria bacterium]MBI2406634.1 hypothetical protein [Candidatus Harrisonbacteria bacterium]